MSKVDANHTASGQVHHKVGGMSVTNTEQVLTHRDEGVRHREVGAQSEVGLGRRTQLLVGSPD